MQISGSIMSFIGFAIGMWVGEGLQEVHLYVGIALTAGVVVQVSCGFIACRTLYCNS